MERTSAASAASGEEKWNAVSCAQNKLSTQQTMQACVHVDISVAKAKVLGRPRGPCAFEEEETIYECKECKGKFVDLVQKQIRGADESMTCFLTCKNCGNRWTEN